VTSISHDLRTPLTAICGYLELLKREEMPDNAARYLSYIENRTTAMKTLTEELFQYSVILSSNSDFPLEPVNLGVILEESIAGFYAPLVQRGITPVIRICEQKVIRPLNVNALSRIFGNILNNALKYSDGDLEITLSNTGEIVFTNTASKLDEVEVSRLFDRFYSVESVRNSTGLGLSIAKLLTRQLDGTINARYSEGRLAIVLRF
jgi:signal transduction histidine kinase